MSAPMPPSMRFVIYAPRYRDNSGGALVLHKLCDVLNKLGHQASLWPMWKPRLSALPEVDAVGMHLLWLGKGLTRKYRTNPRYATPMAKESQIKDSIVVYPEVVSGNPLRARRYVRWLLHEPGFHEGKFRHSSNDLYFTYQEAFNKNCGDMVHGGALTVADCMMDIYRTTNHGPRTKICYMVRKGGDRPDLPDLSDKWVVDGYSHRQLADAFNECRACYFFDLHTMYAAYAAACGCLPIVVPQPGLAKDRWVPEEAGRHGVAYGEDDAGHAIATRELLLENLRRVEEDTASSVRHFVSVVATHFAVPA